jgi:hypothetical protein
MKPLGPAPNVFLKHLLYWILLAVLCLLYGTVLVAGRRRAAGEWIYYGHDGMPAPCPPPKKGYFPRDCP